MITNLLQAIATVITILVCAGIALITLYVSYIIGIGLIVLSLVVVVYYCLKTAKESMSNP